MSKQWFIIDFLQEEPDMRNVICDICGTAYPETAASCPICGSAREYALGSVEDDFDVDAAASSGGKKKNREIFDFDEVNQVKSAGKVMEEDDFDDEEVYEEESRTNVGLVIFLVILIVLLLLAAGFFFVRYLLPNMMEKPEEVPVVTTSAIQQTEPVVTTSAEIPCTNLMMDGGKMTLGKDGKKLLNVRVYPENTTDVVTYSSGDEAVVTVSGDGTVQAVGEGQTVITVQCGSQKIKCNVTVDYSGVDVTVPEGDLPGLQVEEGDATASTDATEATDTTDATQAPEETTEATVPEGEVLKLKKNDITISFLRTSVTLELDCAIPAEDVTWFTMDSSIAIVHDGVVTSMGRGTTKIYAEYEDQQVFCIVRCN